MSQINQSEFDKLKGGILLAFQAKRNREPEYDAIDSLTSRSSALSKMNQYVSDIEKIYREMGFAYSLIERLPEESYLQSLNITSEDYILYHQGYFLELVHQMKDKILRLVDALSKINEKKYEEPPKIKIKTVINHFKISKYQSLINLINKWGQENENPISIALKKRKNNHHFRSTLALNSSYLDVKMSKIFTNLTTQQNILSEYGIQQMKLRGEEGFKKWHEGTKEKILSTKKYISQNLEEISKLLGVIFNLPIFTSNKGKRIALFSYGKGSGKEIVNQASLEKLQKTGIFYQTSKAIEFILKQTIANQLISFYVIGSAARNEIKLGISDLNLVIITEEEMSGLAETLRESIIKPQKQVLSKVIIDVDIQTLSKQQFLHIDNFKTAFSCRYDGVLISGEDLVKQKRYPLPALGLAYLLNKDFKEKTQEVKKYLESTPNLSNSELKRLVIKTVKYALRMFFGEVMANHAVYAVDMKKVKELLLWAHPENFHMIATLYRFLRGNTMTDQNSIKTIVDVLCIEKLYPLLDDLEIKAKSWLTEWEKKY